MESFLHSLSAVALILIMAGIGYALGALKWMGHEQKPFLIKLIVWVCVPFLCIDNFFTSITPDLLLGAGPMLLVAFLSLSATLVLGILLARLFNIEKKRFGGFVVMCALSNSLFVGLPMCTELFGVEAVPFVMVFYIVNTSFFWTFGVLLLKKSGVYASARLDMRAVIKSLANPPFISVVVCTALVLLRFEPPALLMSLSSYMGRLVTPLSLIYVGFVLYETGLKSIRVSGQMLAVLSMRFIAAPFITLLLCLLFKVNGLPRSVLVLEAAMPVMIQSVVVSASVGADESYMAAGLSLTTLFCFIAIPLLMFIL